jgi:hypothetical protein
MSLPISRATRDRLLGTNRQCIATNRLGNRCRRAPLLGATVCNLHGGNAPMAREAARRRLMELVEPAIGGLLRVLSAPSTCAACGRSDDMGTIVAAAKVVLDRTGHGPHSSMSIAHYDGNNDALWPQLSEEQMGALDSVLSAARSVTYATDEEIRALREIGDAIKARVESALAAN